MTAAKFRIPNVDGLEEDSPFNIGDAVGILVFAVLLALIIGLIYLALDHFVGQAAGYVGAAATFLGIAYGIYRIIK